MVTKTNKKKRLVLLDAHAIIHRAYHALPDFTDQNGEPTGALYGVVSMLIRIIQELHPDYLVACYDLPGPTIRHEAYENYKANRQKSDDALITQIVRSREIFKAFSIPMYDREGFEADDVIGTIVQKLSRGRVIEDIIIASGDMDTMQLINAKKVRVYTLKKGLNDTILYDEKAVEQRYGFPPEYIPDWKGLRGDPSDNIIGIPGIGEKTATILVQNFGSMEHLYATLKKDEDAFLKAGIKPRIVGLLKEHEDDALFSKALAVIRTDVPIAFAIPKTPWRPDAHINAITHFLQELGFKSLHDRLQNIMQGDSAIEIASASPQEEEIISPEKMSRAQIMLWLLSSEMTNPSCEDILAYTKQQDFSKAYKELQELIARTGRLEEVYRVIEEPIISIIASMERRGILIDVPALNALSKKYHKELEKLEKNIYKIAGHEFNINSPQQMAVVLFDEMNLSVKNQRHTTTGKRSTRESELQKLSGQHKIISIILEYREVQKLLSTYIDNMQAMLDSEHRLHAQFLQTGTSTGRMASRNPNLQNIPNHKERATAIRNVFVASAGYTFISFDYSQVELRLAAILSGDEKMLAIFQNNRDAHTEVASYIFHVPPEEVDGNMRRHAKVINFGILYGMGVQALHQQTGTSLAEAHTFYQRYFEEFYQLKEYLEHTRGNARANGYTETLFGRRRYFPEMQSSLPYVRAQAERMAINAPVQGSGADMIKLAMTRAHTALKEKNLLGNAHLLLQVHDELVYEVSSEKVEEVAELIAHHMEAVLTKEQSRGVIMRTDIKVGTAWGALMPYTRKV